MCTVMITSKFMTRCDSCVDDGRGGDSCGGGGGGSDGGGGDVTAGLWR